MGFQGVAVVKNPPANAGDTSDVSSTPGSGRSPGVGNGSPLKYSCLENSLDTESEMNEWFSAHTHHNYFKIEW